MADTVQQIMERMTVPLQDMESNGIFSHVWFFELFVHLQEEINSIIRKRRNMEYSLNSYSKTLQDYLAVIEYEMNLESLRKLRKKKLGMTFLYLFRCVQVSSKHWIAITALWEGLSTPLNEWSACTQVT